MPSKAKNTNKDESKSIVIGASSKTGHSIYIQETEYQELLEAVKQMEETDNEAIFKGQLYALIEDKFKGRFSLNQVSDKKYKELKGNWTPKK